MPLPPSSYISLLAHSFLNVFLLLRVVSGANLGITAAAYTVLAWSAPLLLLSIFVFPVGLPSLNPVCGMVTPPRFSALRVLHDRLDVYAPLAPFLFTCLFSLFYAVNGEVERYDPKSLIQYLISDYSQKENRIVSPIEVRSSLAVGFFTVLLLGWLLGDATITADPKERNAEILTAANLERLRIVRYFRPEQMNGEVVPVPPPLNLVSLALRAICGALQLVGKGGRSLHEKLDRQIAPISLGLILPQLILVNQVMNRRNT
jgi:hypothetical protein